VGVAKRLRRFGAKGGKGTVNHQWGERKGQKMERKDSEKAMNWNHMSRYIRPKKRKDWVQIDGEEGARGEKTIGNRFSVS